MLLAEVEFQFYQRGEIDERPAQGMDLPRETSPHLLNGKVVRRGGMGGDQVGDCFGLRKVEFAVHKGPQGEFAGSGHTQSAGKQQLEHLLLDIDRAMARNFDDILAVIGVGRPEKTDQHLVQYPGLVAKGTQVYGMGFGRADIESLFGRPEDLPDHPERIGSRKPDHSNGAHSRGG